MANGQYDTNLPLPIWVRAILQLGFPTAVAAVLLAAVLGWIGSPMMDTLKRIEYSLWYQTAMTRNICYYVAYNAGVRNTESNRCEPWRETRD